MGGTQQCWSISILEDAALEGSQTFTVTLTTLDPDVRIRSSVTSVAIIDNDG